MHKPLLAFAGAWGLAFAAAVLLTWHLGAQDWSEPLWWVGMLGCCVGIVASGVKGAPKGSSC